MLQYTNALKTWTWYPFNQSNLASVPQASGVYALGINDNIIYIGSSVNLHDRLTSHYHTDDPCIARARQFAIEPCSNYREIERQRLRKYLSEHRRLPDCNDVI